MNTNTEHNMQLQKIYKVHIDGVNNVISLLDGYRQKLKNLDYFLNLASGCMVNTLANRAIKHDKPRVAILGVNFPEELIYAVGAEPVWVLGGSYASGIYADKYVPRTQTQSADHPMDIWFVIYLMQLKISTGYCSCNIRQYAKNCLFII